jgi:ribosome maturation factor RimP
MKADFKTIALVGKINSPGCSTSLLRLADYLRTRGHQVMITAHTADVCQIRDFEVATAPC